MEVDPLLKVYSGFEKESVHAQLFLHASITDGRTLELRDLPVLEGAEQVIHLGPDTQDEGIPLLDDVIAVTQIKLLEAATSLIGPNVRPDTGLVEGVPDAVVLLRKGHQPEREGPAVGSREAEGDVLKGRVLLGLFFHPIADPDPMMHRPHFESGLFEVPVMTRVRWIDAGVPGKAHSNPPHSEIPGMISRTELPEAVHGKGGPGLSLGMERRFKQKGKSPYQEKGRSPYDIGGSHQDLAG